MAANVNPFPLIAYYVRMGLARSAIVTADEGLKRRGQEPVLSFWKAVAQAREGNIAGAVRDLEALKSRREVELPASMALSHFENSGDSSTSLSDKTPAAGLTLAAHFAWLVLGDTATARSLTERVFAVNSTHEGCNILRAWIEVTEGMRLPSVSANTVAPSAASEQPASGFASLDATAATTAIGYLEAATANSSGKQMSIDAMMGFAAAYERRGDYARAIDTYTDILNTYNWFLPAACEQARLFTKSGDWDNATESINRVLEVDPSNVECHRLLCMHGLLREGPSLRTVSRLQDLLTAVNKAEPKNPRLYYDISRVCARLACRSRPAISATLALLELAVKIEPENATYLCEVGAQRALIGDFSGASSSYRDASRYDESNLDAVPGMIAVQIAQGLYDDADAQLEMYRLIAESVGSKSVQLTLLEAQLQWRKHKNRREALKLLGACIKTWAEQVGFIDLGTASAKMSKEALSRVQAVEGVSPGMTGSDGLPLPVLMPGPGADFFEFYYTLCLDPTMYDVSRELLLQPDGSNDAAGSLSSMLTAVPHPDVVGRMMPPASVSASLALLSATAMTPPESSVNPAVANPGAAGANMLFLTTALHPSHMPSWLLNASLQAAAENWDAAVGAINRAIELNPTYTDGHLLLAHIGLAKGDTRLASSALESALAQSFAVQETPWYLRMKAAVLAAQTRYEEAVAVIDAAMRIPGVRYSAVKGKLAAGGSAGASPLSVNERASLYLLLAECYLNLDRVPEATKAVTDAMGEFTGTSEEARVIVSSSKLALKRGDASTALSLLTSIPPTSPAYSQAVALKAHIYLTLRRDRRLYIQCYVDLASRQRSEANLVALAEAYMKVQMPEEAITAYEQALSLRPGNTALACKIGRALTLMHDYKRAITYYSSALAAAESTGGSEEGGLTISDKAALRSDLTELLVKLRRFEEAHKLIQDALTESKVGQTGESNVDVISLRYARKNLQLLAKVLKGTGEVASSGEVLEQAYSVQQKIVGIARRDPSSASVGVSMAAAFARLNAITSNISAIDVERLEAADICLSLGLFFERESVPPNDERAKRFYNDASRFAEDINDGSAGTSAEAGGPAPPAAPTTYERSLLALARLHLRRGEIENCRTVCMTITKSNPGCEEAGVMLADLLFRQNDVAAATYHFSTLLEKKPNAYEALARLITLLKRAGRLQDSQRFLRLAVRTVPSAEVNDAGYRFCKALYARYNNEPHESIKLFNTTRLTGTWGVAATEHMVQIYLSPDNDPLWAERDADTSATPEVIADALRVASKLLQDLPKSDRTALHDVLDACILIAQRTRTSVDEAVAKLTVILESDPDYPPALQALASAYMIQKQSPKARNLVKRLHKLPFDSELTDYWVQAHLLMADIYIESGKYDQAADSLNSAIALDSSCARAYEYLGAIAEREVRYAEASELYERAWTYENQASAPVGFKLAFNYLKAGRYVACIDVCHKILKQYPDYPKIKGEVLDKARAMIRS